MPSSRVRRRIGVAATIASFLAFNFVSVVAPAAVSAANPAANIDQCRNGALSTPQGFTQCVNSPAGNTNQGWVNGNAGSSNSHYREAESISYRAEVTNLTAGQQVHLVMQYDVIHSGKHAIDYLTSDNRWQPPETDSTTTPDRPCSGQSCSEPPTSFAAIPPPTTNLQVDTTKSLASGQCQKAGAGATQQPLTSFNALASAEGAGSEKIAFYNATNPVLNYTGPNPNLLDTTGTEAQQIAADFTATGPEVVLAWGGHIASRLDWGCTDGPTSAGGISGSPYHMALIDLKVNGVDFNLGQQDRSLSAAAVIAPPVLSITKTADAPSVSAGSPIGFTITVSNASTAGPASSVALSDPLPQGTGINWSIAGTPTGGATCSITGSPPSQTLGCTLATLAAGGSFSVHVTSPTTGSSCGTYNNVATVGATNFTPISANASTTVNCASIGITKTADATSVNAGDPIGFVVTVTNSGTGTATGVTVTDPLPAGSGAGVTWAIDASGTTGTWTLSGTKPSQSVSFGPVSLAPGASAHVHLTATTSAAECTTYNNTATAASTNDGGGQASASITCNPANIGITKTADAASVTAGSNIGFVVTVTNTGTGTAHGVTVTDPLPTNAGLNWTIDTANSSSGWSISAGVLSYGPTDLGAGASVHVHITSPTTNATCGTVNNTANVTTTNDGSGSASASVVVNCPKGLIAPTQTTCQQYASGTAQPEPPLTYGIKNNKVNNVAPGVVFYFTTITVTGPGTHTIQVTNSANPTFPAIAVAQGQAAVYTTNCVQVTTMTVSGANSQIATASVSAGTYIIQIKYNPNSLVGTSITSPTNFTYTWTTSIDNTTDPNSNASIALNPK